MSRDLFKFKKIAIKHLIKNLNVSVIIVRNVNSNLKILFDFLWSLGHFREIKKKFFIRL